MTCPLCRHENAKAFIETKSFGYPVRYVQCLHCGLVHQPTGETAAADPVFYEETYRKVYQADDRPITKDLKIQEMRAQHLIQYLRTAGVEAIPRALDIGASAGVLLSAYRSALGSETVGVEPGRAYRAAAQASGHDMFVSLEELIKSKPAPFQLVSLIHVAEHLDDPVAMLTQIRQSLLTSDGLLLLEVPNFYAHDSYELAHLACYTPHSLREMVRQAGFEVVNLSIHGFPRSEILGLYLSILARPVDRIDVPMLKPEKAVGIKRKAAMLYRKLLQKVFPLRAWLPLPE